MQESATAKAERIATEELAQRQWDPATLAARRKGDAEKVQIAQQLQRSQQ